MNEEYGHFQVSLRVCEQVSDQIITIPVVMIPACPDSSSAIDNACFSLIWEEMEYI